MDGYTPLPLTFEAEGRMAASLSWVECADWLHDHCSSTGCSSGLAAKRVLSPQRW
jgi:hypothetical protein